EGFLLSNTERLGRIRGAGWYAQLSGWPLGDAYVRPEPGISAPRQLDLSRSEGAAKRGLELLALFAGVNASYDGAIRGGELAPAAPPPTIQGYALAFAAQYWHTQHVRLMLEYAAYLTPKSGETNAAGVPDNRTATGGELGRGHALHELG